MTEECIAWSLVVINWEELPIDWYNPFQKSQPFPRPTMNNIIIVVHIAAIESKTKQVHSLFLSCICTPSIISTLSEMVSGMQ